MRRPIMQHAEPDQTEKSRRNLGLPIGRGGVEFGSTRGADKRRVAMVIGCSRRRPPGKEFAACLGVK